MTDDLSDCYKQAQNIVQGLMSKKLVLNDTLFPRWIGDTDCFWYMRESTEGNNYRLVTPADANNSEAFDPSGIGESIGEANGEFSRS